MATVKQTFSPQEAEPQVGLAFPNLVKTTGTSAPVVALAYDPTTAQSAFWTWLAENYGSGNLTLNLFWYADTATSGNIKWNAQIAAITPDTDTQDIETKAFATLNTVTDSHLGTTGQRLHTCTIAISNLDSLAAGDLVFLKITRDAADAADTMTGLANLVLAEITYSDT